MQDRAPCLRASTLPDAIHSSSPKKLRINPYNLYQSHKVNSQGATELIPGLLGSHISMMCVDPITKSVVVMVGTEGMVGTAGPVDPIGVLELHSPAHPAVYRHYVCNCWNGRLRVFVCV